LDSLAAARDEWDKCVEREKSEAEALPPSVFPASPPNADSTSSSPHLLHASKNEPPITEHLEEYRRKLAFLANLLNSPRWALPHSESAMSKLVRNERVPYQEQQAELGILSKVQTHVRNNLRAQLALQPLSGSTVTRPASGSLEMELESTTHTSADESTWMSGSEEDTQPLSPTKKLLGSGGHSSPRHGSPNSRSLINGDLEHVFLQASDSSSEEGRFGSEDQRSAESTEVWSPKSSSSSSNADFSAGDASHQQHNRKPPVARQLWTSVDSLSSQSTGLSRRIARGEDSELGDLNRLLSADLRQQDELTDELVQYAAAMKEAALHAGNKIRSDAKQLEKMSDRMEANTHATKQASSTVNELLNASGGSVWGYLSTMSTVILVFIVVYIFMKIVPKP